MKNKVQDYHISKGADSHFFILNDKKLIFAIYKPTLETTQSFYDGKIQLTV